MLLVLGVQSIYRPIFANPEYESITFLGTSFKPLKRKMTVIPSIQPRRLEHLIKLRRRARI